MQGLLSNLVSLGKKDFTGIVRTEHASADASPKDDPRELSSYEIFRLEQDQPLSQARD